MYNERILQRRLPLTIINAVNTVQEDAVRRSGEAVVNNESGTVYSWPICCLPHSVCLVYTLSTVPIHIDKGARCLIHFRKAGKHITPFRSSNPNSIFAKVNGQASRRRGEKCKGGCFKSSSFQWQTRANIWSLCFGCILNDLCQSAVWLNRQRGDRQALWFGPREAQLYRSHYHKTSPRTAQGWEWMDTKL